MTSLPKAENQGWIIFLAAILLMLGVHALPEPGPLERGGQLIPLTAGGKACIGIMVFAVTLWVTEAIPFAVTSLLVLLLIPVFGIADFRAVVRAGFGHPVITFFLGVLMMSAAFTRSGLGKRLVYFMLLRVGTRTDRVLLGFLAVGALLSMWVTDMAVAAMLLPIGMSILRDADLKPLQSNFGRALMIAAAFGPLMGGIATPAGTAANLVAIGQLRLLAEVDISFGRWMMYGAPATVLMIPIAWRLLLWFFPPEIDVLPITRGELQDRYLKLGPVGGTQLRTLVIFCVVIGTWLLTPLLARWTGGLFAPPIEAVALAGGLSLFLPGVRVLTWKEAEQDVEWGGLMLIVAGLSLGLAVFETGAARWLAWVLLGQISAVPALLQPFIIVLAVAGLHFMFSSNTVTASIIIPILVALATDLGLDVWSIVAPAAFTSSLAFVLVSEGPTTIIPYSSGYFTMKDMAKVGVVMTVAAAACVTASITAARLLAL